MTNQPPSVGRIVHYVSYGTPGGEFESVCRAAIIAEVDGASEDCGLVVFNPQGLYFNFCRHDEDEKKDGTWHWPERVEETTP